MVRKVPEKETSFEGTDSDAKGIGADTVLEAAKSLPLTGCGTTGLCVLVNVDALYFNAAARGMYNH